MEKEIRTFNGGIEYREGKDGEPGKIVGLGIVFDSLSENLGGFREKIDRSAFDHLLKEDVRALFNHDPNYVLGRTISKTLQLRKTERGIEYEFEEPKGAVMREMVVEPIKRGDISGSSFGFNVDEGGDKWEKDGEGRYVRTVLKARALFDMGPVTFPAYQASTATKRSLDEAIKKMENRGNEGWEDEIEVLEAELQLQKEL